MNAELVVGATADKVALRLPVPFITKGSPNILANSFVATVERSWIVLNSCSFNRDASTDSKGIILDCSSEWSPSTPNPNARFSTANVYAFSMNVKICRLSKLSESR